MRTAEQTQDLFKMAVYEDLKALDWGRIHNLLEQDEPRSGTWFPVQTSIEPVRTHYVPEASAAAVDAWCDELERELDQGLSRLLPRSLAIQDMADALCQSGRRKELIACADVRFAGRSADKLWGMRRMAQLVGNAPLMWVATITQVTLFFTAMSEDEVLERLMVIPEKRHFPVPRSVLVKMAHRRIGILRKAIREHNSWVAQAGSRAGMVLSERDLDTVAAVRSYLGTAPYMVGRAIGEFGKLLSKPELDDSVMQDGWKLSAVEDVHES